MSYSIIRVAKIKGGVNTTGVQKHVQRENKNYNNKDIDHERTRENYDLLRGQEKVDFKKLIDERIEEGYTGKRKIRSDAIRHIDGVVTSDKDFFNRMDQGQTRKFFEDSLEFLEKEYGRKNLLYATVHMDEATPHMHFGVVPLTEDGRLSAKDVVGNKKALTEFQDRFNAFVNERGHDLERGEPKQVTGKKHEEMDKFKQSTRFHEQQLQAVQEKLSSGKSELEKVADVLQVQPEVEFERKEKVTEVNDRLIGKAEILEKETENIVLTPDEVKTVNEQLRSAAVIKKDYDRLRSTDFVQENEKLRKQKDFAENYIFEQSEISNKLKEENQKLKKENATLKSELEAFKRNVIILYKNTREVFKTSFNAFRERLSGEMKEEKTDNKFEKVHQVYEKRLRQQNQEMER